MFSQEEQSDSGSSASLPDFSILLTASTPNPVAASKLILKEALIDEIRLNEKRLFKKAIKDGKLNKVQNLVQNEYLIFDRITKNLTALQFACQTRHIDIIVFLLSIIQSKNALSHVWFTSKTKPYLAELMVFVAELIDEQNMFELQKLVCKPFEVFFNLNHLSDIYKILQEIVSEPNWLAGRSLAHLLAGCVRIEEKSWEHFHLLNLNRPNQQGIYPIHLAAKVGNDSFAKLAFHYSKKNPLISTDRKNRRPVHYAAKYNQSDFFVELIDLGANMQVRDDKGRTPREIAKKKQNTEVLTTIDECYETLELMLHFIRQEKEDDVLELLEGWEALLFQTNEEQESILTLASQYSLHHLVFILVEKMISHEDFFDFLHSLPPDHITTRLVMSILTTTIRSFDKKAYENCRDFTRNYPGISDINIQPIENLIQPLMNSAGKLVVACNADKEQSLVSSVVNESTVTRWDLTSRDNTMIDLDCINRGQLLIESEYVVFGGAYHELVIVFLRKDTKEKCFEYCEDFKGESKLKSVKRPMAVGNGFLAFATEEENDYRIILYNFLTKEQQHIIFFEQITAIDLMDYVLMVGTNRGSVDQIFIRDGINRVKIVHETKSISNIKIISSAKFLYCLQEDCFYIKSIYKTQKRTMRPNIIDIKISPAGYLYILSEHGIIQVWSDKSKNYLYMLRGGKGRIVGFLIHPKGFLVTVEEMPDQFYLQTYTLERPIELLLDGRSYRFIKNLVTGNWSLPPQFSMNRRLELALSQISGWTNPPSELLEQLKSACLAYFCHPFLNLSVACLNDITLDAIATSNLLGSSSAQIKDYLDYFKVCTFQLNEVGEYLHHLAAEANNLLLLKYIFEKVNVRHSSNQNLLKTAVNRAIIGGSTDCLPFLLSLLLNKKKPPGCEPFLLLAVRHNSLDSVNILLAHDFRAEIVDALRLAKELNCQFIENRLLSEQVSQDSDLLGLTITPGR